MSTEHWLPPSPKAYEDCFYAVYPHTFANYRAGYLDLWGRMTVTKGAETRKQVDLIVKHRAVYERVEAATGVPWIVIGLLHLREAGPQDVGRWKGILHNGQPIVGTGRKSTIVPKGVGPFATWHEAAVHAVRQEGLDKINWSKDGIAYVAFASEIFNGFGYRGKGIPSPYLWGGTSVQKRGKYVADGVFDSGTMDPQIGTMALLRVLMDATGYTFGTATAPSPKQAPQPAPEPQPEQAPEQSPAPRTKTSLLELIVGAIIKAIFK